MSGITEAFLALSDPITWILVFIGVLAGIVIGAMPGLSATVGIAILLPFTFGFEPIQGLSFLLAIYTSAAYAGAIPAVLVRTPGTPAAAATVLDGYPMAQHGAAGKALTVSLLASVLGALVGLVVLSFLASPLAEVAGNFDSATYFAVTVLALTVVASLGGTSVNKALISVGIGIAIISIGFDPVTNYPRFDIMGYDLRSGIEIIPLLVGLFGVAEALKHIEKAASEHKGLGVGTFRITAREGRELAPAAMIGSTAGFVSGLLPGVGGDIGGYLGYNEAHRFAKDKRSFGFGNPKGVAAAEAANNASNMASLAPTLSLGIPGNTQAAVMIGALLIHGLNPGPNLFSEEPRLVYGSFMFMAVSLIFVIILGLLGIRLWAQIMYIPERYLWPGVVVLAIIGSYAVRNSGFDVLIMALAGLLGYIMSKQSIPIAPLLVAVIVGPIMEENLRREISLNGGSLAWILDPYPLVILSIAVVALLYGIIGNLMSRRQ